LTFKYQHKTALPFPIQCLALELPSVGIERMDYDTEIEQLKVASAAVDAEIEELLAKEAEVDTEIAGLLAKERQAKEEDFRSKPRRFVTSYEIVNHRLIEPWSDPAELPKRTTTHDIISRHLLVEWSDPALLPKRKTTHDLAVEQLTQEHMPIDLGTLQLSQ
jgi:hypothetical protein